MFFITTSCTFLQQFAYITLRGNIMDMDKKEYTSNELCLKYGISRVTLDRYKKNKNFPYYKRGRSVFFLIDEVEKWFEEYNKVKKYNNYEEKKETSN